MNQLQIKRTCVNAVLTRLKSNDIHSNDDRWKILKKGLYRLSVEQLDALQDLIANKNVPNGTCI